MNFKAAIQKNSVTFTQRYIMSETILDDLQLGQNKLLYGINQKDGFTQFLILMGIFVACFIAGQLLSAGLLYLSYGLDVADMSTLMKKHKDLNAFRYAQMLATVFSFLAPAIIFSKQKQKNWLQYNRADKSFNLVLIALIPLLIISFYPLINVSFFLNKSLGISNWFQGMQGDYKEIVLALTAGTSVSTLILNLITVAVLPAICEEWFFRGTMQRFFSEKMNIHLAIFLSSIAFSLIHLEFSGFLPRIFLGMLLGYIYYYSGSLWASIFAHLINNGAQVVAIYLSNKGLYTVNMDNPDFPTYRELLIFTPLFIALFFGMIYLSKQKRSTFA